MIFAVAHVRGGGEMGRLWYEHGKKLEKRNTFTDFAAVARHLIDEDITAPDRLVAAGRQRRRPAHRRRREPRAESTSRASSPRCRSSTR